jgi:signal transduction histidine kinase
MLVKAINNLFWSAARHAAMGGSVGVAVAGEGDRVSLTIQAAPKNEAGFQHLFEAIQGLDKAFAGGPGSGFTIHTTRQLASQFGGDLELRRLRNSVELVLRLPAARADQPTPAAPATPIPAAGA